jgi:hypothetical protein
MLLPLLLLPACASTPPTVAGAEKVEKMERRDVIRGVGECEDAGMKPYVEYFKESRKDDVIIYTIDTDKEPEISKEYNIQSLPTIMMFKNNKMVYQNIGYMSEEDLSNAINQNK